ncbi:MAG: hypothetical protein ACREMS_13040 [Gemmatimonadaceae bacterium]
MPKGTRECYPVNFAFRLRGELLYGYMRTFRAPRSSTLRWLRLGAVVLALVGQGGLLGASLNLVKDETSAISHTEQNGIDLHHGHNEATCPSCIALSLQGTPAIVAELPRLKSASAGITTTVLETPGARVVFLNQSRAPPGIF